MIGTKVRLILIILSLCTSICLSAQESFSKIESKFNAKGTFESRIHLGVNLSRSNNFGNAEFGSGVGLTASAGFGYFIGKKLQVRSGLTFLTRRTTSNFGTKTTDVDKSALIPIILEFKTNRAWVFIGRHLSYLYDAYYSISNSDKIDITDERNRYNYGFDLGIGYDIYNDKFKVRIQGNAIIDSNYWTGNLGLVLLK